MEGRYSKDEELAGIKKRNQYGEKMPQIIGIVIRQNKKSAAEEKDQETY